MRSKWGLIGVNDTPIDKDKDKEYFFLFCVTFFFLCLFAKIIYCKFTKDEKNTYRNKKAKRHT